MYESSLRQWEQGSQPSDVARRHFAEGSQGGTYNGVPGAEPQDFETVLRRLERAVGSLSNTPGPEITPDWSRLPAELRELKNREIEATVATLEAAIRQGRAERPETPRPESSPEAAPAPPSRDSTGPAGDDPSASWGAAQRA